MSLAINNAIAHVGSMGPGRKQNGGAHSTKKKNCKSFCFHFNCLFLLSVGDCGWIHKPFSHVIFPIDAINARVISEIDTHQKLAQFWCVCFLKQISNKKNVCNQTGNYFFFCFRNAHLISSSSSVLVFIVPIMGS